MRLVTPGAFDVIEVTGVDSDEEWLYFTASPENATHQYLYRIRIDGKSKPERLTPANQPGTHSYQVSPDLHFAFHTYSAFDTRRSAQEKTVPGSVARPSILSPSSETMKLMSSGGPCWPLIF